MSHSISLSEHGLNVAEVHHNLPPCALYEHSIRYEKKAVAYATVYPLTTLLRILSAQVLAITLLG